MECFLLQLARRGNKQPPADWQSVVGRPAIATKHTKAIDWRWNDGSPAGSLPDEHFAVVATTEVTVSEGDYDLIVESDDGVRVFVDEHLKINNWTWHATTTDTARVGLSAGKHTIRIEYFEIDGCATLACGLTAAMGAPCRAPSVDWSCRHFGKTGRQLPPGRACRGIRQVSGVRAVRIENLKLAAARYQVGSTVTTTYELVNRATKVISVSASSRVPNSILERSNCG